ncbi:MAG: sugar phosphate isomerase/epimerase family protein [Luteitalea sp.]
MSIAPTSRRAFLAASAALVAATSALADGVEQPPASTTRGGDAPRSPAAVVLPRAVALGFDSFSVRASNWKAARLLEYGSAIAADSVLISDLDAFESLEEPPLRKVRDDAAARNLSLHVGTWSVCPTSKAFRPANGTADEQLARGIRVARLVGSPVLRVVLGTWEDRLTDGGIGRHIDSLVSVLKGGRSQALDASVRIAVENHAGDMRAEEVAALVEMAGRDFVGVNFDSGNSLWTLENPLDALEIVAPYIVTTSLRDGVVTDIPTGCRVTWTAMGDGQIDFVRFMPRFAELCSGVPVHIETISGVGRDFPIFEDQFWAAWPRLEGSNLARFLRMARRKVPVAPTTTRPNDAADQRRELERSLAYCRQTLGLGLRTARPTA